MTHDFRILGPLEVSDETGHVALGGRQQRGLLAILVLDAGRVSRRTASSICWGDDAPKTATASLQNAIARLRRVLGEDVLVTRSPGYVLSVTPEQIDARRFERELTHARALPAAERVDRLQAALALWRGSALAEFAFDDFAQAEIRRLEELRLVAVEERIDAELELGRHADVVGELEALVAAHPLRETFRRQQMLALYRSARQAEALDAYQNARSRFVSELGIEPGPELKRLQAEILRQEAGLATPGTQGAPADDDGEIVKALLAGRIVLVLGLDGAGDLAAHIALAFGVPTTIGPSTSRACRSTSRRCRAWAAVRRASRPLRGGSRADAAPPLSRAASGAPARAGAPHSPHREHELRPRARAAFEEAEEELDIVAYVATGPYRGRFWHRSPGRHRVRSTSRTRMRQSSRSNVGRFCSSFTVPWIRSQSASGRAS